MTERQLCCFRLSSQIVLSRPVRSTLAKSLSKLNPAESIAKLKEAGRKVREHLQRPTLERNYDPDPLFQDSESDAQEMSRHTRSPNLVASPTRSLSQDVDPNNTHRQNDILGSYSDEPLSGSDAEPQLPRIHEGVMLQAPHPLYRQHASSDQNSTLQQSGQEPQPASRTPLSPFDSSYSATQTAAAGDVGPGMLSSQPIFGNTEVTSTAGRYRVSPDRPFVPSRLSNTVQLALDGLSDNRQIAFNGLPTDRPLPPSSLYSTTEMAPNGLFSERQLPPNGLSSERQLSPSGLSSERQLPNGLSSTRQLPPNGLSSQRQLPPTGLSSERQLPPNGLSSERQLQPNGVALPRQLSVGPGQQIFDRPPVRPMDRPYASARHLGADRAADRRFTSDRQLGLGRLSDTPILEGRVASKQVLFPEQSAGSRRYSRQKSGKNTLSQDFCLQYWLPGIAAILLSEVCCSALAIDQADMPHLLQHLAQKQSRQIDQCHMSCYRH